MSAKVRARPPKKNLWRVEIRVLIDFERLKYRYTGLGQFSYFLGKELALQVQKPLELTYLVPSGSEDDFGRNVRLERANLLRRFLPQTGRRYDLWHSTHQDSSFFPASSKDRYLLTIHDLNFVFEKSPEKIKKRLSVLQKKIDRASAITAISKYTADQVNEYLDLKGLPIEVIYNGVAMDAVAGVAPKRLRARFRERPFLFSLGVIRPKKNLHVLLGMLARTRNANLVIAGGDADEGYLQRLEEDVNELGLAERVQILGEVNGEEKAWLYEKCQGFVFPSLLEGFGLPVIEAMSIGKPVFISNCTCLPEIGGDEAYVWDSFDPDKMAAVLENGLADYESNPDKKSQLQKHASRFSWQKAAREYLKIYESVLS